MPVDSPIKHSCASHVESPDPSPVEISIDSQPSVAKVQGSRGLGISSEPDAGVFPDGEQQPLLMRGTDTDAHSAASRSGATAQEQQEQQRNHRSELILRHHHHCDCHSKSACPDIYIPGYSAECEYACTKASCYQFEHCHITPLYPHAHTHAHPGQHEQGVPHSHGQCYSPVVHDDPESYHSYHHALLDPEDTSGSTSNTDIHQHHVSSSYSHGHRCDHHVHEPEPRVQLSGPGDHTASEVSGHHQQLLLHVGLQTAVAIALHKIPEGLIIFLSRKASPKLGLSVAASLFFHNLPEGLMLALPLFLATGKRTRAFLVSALMGAAPPVVGAAVGSWLLSDAAQDSDADLSGTFGVAFGITAGMMCMVSLNGMLPTARIYDKSGNVVAWSFAFGVASMLFANSTLK
ncbi:Zinc transporter [Dipsacomyces acuminosporus]|nr:Zinc transporter [Dipsacomyces acuminosporus]